MNVITERYSLYLGDCIDVMQGFAPNSFDTLCTDCPSGIAFMGKTWDNHTRYITRTDKGQRTLDALTLLDLEPWAAGFVAFTVDWAVEALRVLKPGAMGLVWALPRTSDLTGLGLRLAGFECRDNLYHLFGSGFPKSHDIAKSIDSRGGASIGWFGPWLRQERERRGIAQKELSIHFPSKTGGLTGCVANWELGLNLPTPEQFNKLCEVLELPFDHIEAAEREVIGKGFDAGNRQVAILGTEPKEWDITAPATDAAREWAGYGTALKPSVEEWILVMKPLTSTFSANALQHGVAGLNIDGCRIGNSKNVPASGASKKNNGYEGGWGGGIGREQGTGFDPAIGRWPANLILDRPAAALLDEMSGERPTGDLKPYKRKHTETVDFKSGCEWETATHQGDTGGASRYFTVLPDSEPRFCYTAKASTSERNEGLDGLPESVSHAAYGEFKGTPEHAANTNGSSRNPHPTVKPLSLMRWLVRLTKTPTGGSVLDPFGGSGTTVIACLLEGRHCTYIDKEREYFEITRHRSEHWQDEASTEPRKLRGKDSDLSGMPLFADIGG